MILYKAFFVALCTVLRILVMLFLELSTFLLGYPMIHHFELVLMDRALLLVDWSFPYWYGGLQNVQTIDLFFVSGSQ